MNTNALRKFLSGSPKVENVNFGSNRVVSNIIYQDISWRTVQLQNDDTKYILKYNYVGGLSSVGLLSTNSYTMRLNVTNSNTTFTVWVAATQSRTPSFRGDFSDPKSITYTSMFDDHYWHCHDIHTVSQIHTCLSLQLLAHLKT